MKSERIYISRWVSWLDAQSRAQWERRRQKKNKYENSETLLNRINEEEKRIMQIDETKTNVSSTWIWFVETFCSKKEPTKLQ